jgi:hypothetical protein
MSRETRAAYIARISAALQRDEPATHCLLPEREKRLMQLAECDARLLILGQRLRTCRTAHAKRELLHRIDVWLDHRLSLLGR